MVYLKYKIQAKELLKLLILIITLFLYKLYLSKNKKYLIILYFIASSLASIYIYIYLTNITHTYIYTSAIFCIPFLSVKRLTEIQKRLQKEKRARSKLY